MIDEDPEERGSRPLEDVATLMSSVAAESAWGDALHAESTRDELDASQQPRDRFEVRGELGAGGMGRVLLAHDRWLDRDVALKEPRDDEDVQRLRREATLTARLEHPGILPIYDVGASPDGRPWFAMRLVRGVSLADAIAKAPTLAERLRLVRPLLSVCETVAFAHERGIVHRDLKPANIMLGTFGEATVIDWGLAEDLAGPHARPTARPAGTVHYMSPSQARLEPPGPGDDVFSLGLILAEAVAGTRLFDSRSAQAHLLRLRELTSRTTPVLPRWVPSELRAIIRRAIAPESALRYPHAKALADDLARYLDGARVSAHRYSFKELLLRAARAYRLPLVILAIALTTVVGLVVAGMNRVRAERDLAADSLALALGVSAERALARDAVAEAEVLAAHASAHRSTPEVRGVLAQLTRRRPALTRDPEPPPCRPIAVNGQRLVCREPTGLSIHEGHRLLWQVAVDNSYIADFTPDGAALVISNRWHLSYHDAGTGHRLYGPVLPPAFAAFIRSGAPDALIVLTAQSGTRVRGDGLTQLPNAPCGGETTLAAAALDTSGESWALACIDGSLSVGRFGEAGHRQVVRGDGARHHQPTALAFVPGGEALLIGTTQGEVVFLELATAERTLIAASGRYVTGIETDAAGRLALVRFDGEPPLVVEIQARAPLGRLPTRTRDAAISIASDGTIRSVGTSAEQWDFSGVRPRALRFAEGIVTLSASPDGDRLAVAHGPVLTVVDVAARRRIGVQKWPGWMVKDVAFHPAAPRLVAYGFGESSFVWMRDDPTLEVLERWPQVMSVRRLGVLADGGVIHSTHAAGVLLHREALDHDTLGVLLDWQSAADLVVSFDGLRVAMLGDDASVFGGDAAVLGRGDLGFEPCGTFPGARAVALDPAASAIFVANQGGVTVTCERGSTQSEGPYVAPGVSFVAVAASQDWVAAGARNGDLWIWRRGQPGAPVVAKAHEARVSELVIDPRQRWLASGGWDGRVVFMDLPPAPPETPELVEVAWSLTLAEIIDDVGEPVSPTP